MRYCLLIDSASPTHLYASVASGDAAGLYRTKDAGRTWASRRRVRLEVIDRATDEALQRLIDAGLLAKTTRASRPLWPADAAETAPPLSPAELEKLSAHRQRAARKLKMARVLCDGGLSEEARAALLEAVAALGCALAVQHRLPEPASLDDALLPPLSPCWKEACASAPVHCRRRAPLPAGLGSAGPVCGRGASRRPDNMNRRGLEQAAISTARAEHTS